MNIPSEFVQNVRESLKAHIGDVCPHLLPGGKRVNGEWQCGGVDGGPGKSMGVVMAGEKAGVWHDRATGEAGDLLELFMAVRGLKFTEAVEQAADFCRMGKPDESDGKVDPSDFHFSAPPAPKAEDDGIPPYQAPAKIATVIDWARCVGEFTEDKAAELCALRGYSVGVVTWMDADTSSDSNDFKVTGSDGFVNSAETDCQRDGGILSGGHAELRPARGGRSQV